jgi:hypothetical protein
MLLKLILFLLLHLWSLPETDNYVDRPMILCRDGNGLQADALSQRDSHGALQSCKVVGG